MAVNYVSQESALLALHATLILDPVTCVETIGTIISWLEENNAAKAEEQFRTGIINKLNSVSRTLAEIKQKITELGVELKEEIRAIPVITAENNLFSNLFAVQTAYTDLPLNPTRAIALFDDLNKATAAAAEYGPALLPMVSVGIIGLLNIDPFTQQPLSVRKKLAQQYADILQEYLHPNKPNTLMAQKAEFNRLCAEAENNINSFLVPPRRIGTHDYGQTWVIENVRMTQDGWFEYWDTDEHKPQKPVKDHIGGRWNPLMVFTVLSANDPIPPNEVIFYTRGVRKLKTQNELSAAHNENFDQHIDEWRGHIATHALEANRAVSLKRHMMSRVDALDQSIHIAQAMLSLCTKIGQ
jgi:hypothetical protein